MTADLVKRALEIVDDAILLDMTQRADFIATACGDDTALKDKVNHLLQFEQGVSIAAATSEEVAVELPDDSRSPSRYELGEEIARGGMGVVFSARDCDLERDVAVKVLHEGQLTNSDALRRFLFEARIGARLQHPGIAPVYDLGLLAPDKPFFAMKLVRGETLSALLSQRATLDEDRSRFLSIFNQICQTVAYAHSVDIIHRDLKPDNVMVGQFDEVQVMDWGLAKILADDREPSEDSGKDSLSNGNASCAKGTSVDDLSSSAQTMAGTVMGSPSYMPPEQTVGERGKPSDVFALGAVLCEILTGTPPYSAESPIETLALATKGDMREALEKLEALEHVEADRELARIATKCLAIAPGMRYPDASYLAKDVAGYLSSVQSRLREAEVAAAKTETKLAEERKRRGIVAGLSSLIGIAVIVSLAGLSWALLLRAKNAESDAIHAQQMAAKAEEISAQTQALARVEQQERLRKSEVESEFNTAILEATRLFERAKAAPLNMQQVWDEARAAIARAEAVVELNPDYPSLATELKAVKDSFQSTESELKIALAVTQARNETFDDPEFVPWGDTRPKLTKLDRVVSDNGFHPDSHADEPIIIERIRTLPWAIREQLIGAMDEWYLTADESHRETFTKILHESDDNALRKQWRAAFTEGDDDTLKEVFANPKARQLPARTIVNLIHSLEKHVDANTRIDFLQKYWSMHRNDAWYNYQLADLLQSNNRTAEAIPYYHAFLMARPNHRARVFLAYAQMRQGDFDEATVHLKSALLERPDNLAYRNLLTYTLLRADRQEEAVSFCEVSLRVRPNDWYARLSLGAALLELGQYDQAIDHLKMLDGNVPQEAIWQIHVLLAKALHASGNKEESLAVFEKVDVTNPVLAGRLAQTIRDFDLDPNVTRAKAPPTENAANWQPIVSTAARTYSGATLVSEEDGWFQIEGDRQAYDAYMIPFEAKVVTAIRLELDSDEEECELGEIALELVDGQSPSRPVQLAFCRLCDEGDSTTHPIERSIDGNLQTTWRAGAYQAAVFILDAPIELQPGQHLRLNLRHGGSSGITTSNFRAEYTDHPNEMDLKLPMLVLSN